MRTTQAGRPVAVITTIEGVVKVELQARCVEVQYSVTSDETDRDPIEREIRERRHQIGTAMIFVFVQYFQICRESRPTPNPIPNFKEHFTALCNLLRAFGDVANKPEHWAEEVIQQWNRTLLDRESDDSELEHPLRRVLEENIATFTRHSLTHAGVNGTLHVSEAAHVLTGLQKLNLREPKLPTTANGLSRRLSSSRFHSIVYLRTDTENIPVLRRT